MLGGHQDPLVLVKQPSTFKERQQPSKCVSIERTCGELQTGTFSRASIQVRATSLSRDTASLLQGQPLGEKERKCRWEMKS